MSTRTPWLRRLVFTLSALSLLSATPLGISPVAVAEPAPCPNVEVTFARGTGDAPGVGWVGQAFVDSLRARVGQKSVGVYAVNYPATTDFPTAAQGIVDASTHVRDMAARCPKTRQVLGGYSQGAAVIGYITAAEIPAGYSVPADITGPMPADVADHVAAVALFGQPAPRFLGLINAPPIVIGPLYASKTVNECVAGDPVCSDSGGDFGAHNDYVEDGLVNQAADFAAGKLSR
jgi:cutinase